MPMSMPSSTIQPQTTSCASSSSIMSTQLTHRRSAVPSTTSGSLYGRSDAPIARRRLGAAGCRALNSSATAGLAVGHRCRKAGMLGRTAAAQNNGLRIVNSSSTAARPNSHVACAQRRKLFGGEGGSTQDGSTSGSSSDEDTPVPQIPPQQLRAQQAAAGEAERQRKRQDALRRIEASAARLARKRGTGSATIDSALQQMLAKELVADAADIVASSPSTLKQQLAQEGADLEADWAEAEANSAAALTTTGRAKTLAALAASKGLSPTDVLRPTRPTLRPELPFPEDDDFYDDDDDDAWQEILDSDDLPLWEDSRYSGLLAGKDPVAAAAASIRRQIDDPAFQAWLRQQEQQRDAKEARERREAELEAKLLAGKSAAERVRRQQDAMDLAKVQSKLQQQQQQQGMARPLMRPNAPAGGGSDQSGGSVEDVVTDPHNVRKSDVGLTPAEMAMLFEEFGAETDISSSSSSRQKLQAPVFTPKQGYSFSAEGRAAASRLAGAGASGQLQRPLLVRPSVRPTGTAGSSILDSQYWDQEEASAAAAAQEAAERNAFIQSVLAEQQQQQQQRQRRPQQDAGPAIDADRLAVAAENVKKAVLDAQLKRPARPGAAAATGQCQGAAKPLSGLSAAAGPQQPGDRFAAAAAAAASLQRPASQAQQQEQAAAAAAWDAEEAAAAAVAQQEADRLALLEQLQAEADAADLIAFAVAAAEPNPKKATPKVPAPSSSSSGSSSTVAAKPGLQGVKRPAQRPQQQQQQQQGQTQGSKVGRKLSPAQLQAAKPQQQQQQLKKPQRPQAPAAVAAEQREEDLTTAWDAVEAAEAKVAQADAAKRELLQQLAAEAQAAEEEAAAAGGSSKAAAKAGKKDSSSSKQGTLQVPDVSQKTLEALSGLKKPPARPAAAAAATAAAAAAPSVPKKKGTKQQQQQQQQGKQAQAADKQKQQGKGTKPVQPAAPAVKQAPAPPTAAAAADSEQLLLSPEDLDLFDQAAKGGLRTAGKQPQQQQQQQQQQSGQIDADKAALKQRLEQAAQTLQKAAVPPQLQRPVRPSPAVAAATPKSARLQTGSNSSSSVQVPAAQSAGAVDWRFAEAAAASSSSSGGSGGSSNNNSSRLAGVRRESLPRTIPEHKLQLAKYLEVSRTPTTAVVIGTAAKANGYLSLIVQLEELECVTLMPVSQLLPSQLVQLFDEMQMAVPRFLYEGKPLRNQGYMGQQAVAALKNWKGRKLDVIVSTMRQPDYATFAARERPAAGVTPLRRYSRLFWLRLTRSCQMVVADRLTGADELSSDVAAMLSGTDSLDRQKDIAAFVKDFISLDAAATADNGMSVSRPYLAKSPAVLERDVTGAVYQVELADSVALSLRDCLASSSVIDQAAATLLGANSDHAADPSLVVKPFRELLMQLQAQQSVSEDAASILFQPEDSSGAKYARCVAVAAWPPAWLDQELSSSSSTSASGSASVLYVTDRELLTRISHAADSNSPGFTWPQALLWRLAAQYRRREGVDSTEPTTDRIFEAQVVGVHSKGYLLCQVMHEPDTRKATTLEELTEPTIAAATVAVPLSECPPSLRLHLSQQQQQQQEGEAGDVGGSAGLSLHQEQQQPRWEPWELQQSAAAAAAAAGTTADSPAMLQDLQGWRQGALGLWRQPYLKVKLQLLPLEQQQDVAALEAMQAEVADWALESEQFAEKFNIENYGIGRVSKEDFEDRGPPPHSSFGDTLNMLLLGRIVEDSIER